ncbi:MAG TPA: PQQ-dependent sugar dehydrogenase [Chloroflexia bacterium]|nr:PQQ-dependent sugar dehydrogenase [Chloroflexia bacterium]
MLTRPGNSKLKTQNSKLGIIGALALFAAMLLLSAPSQAQSEQEALPPGARIETLLEDMNRPVAMAFDPAGRIFYTEKETGNVRLFANGQLQLNPVITFSVDGGGEQGLLGIAIDPNFNSNRFIYVYYTCSTRDPGCPNKENRVARFVERDGAGSSPTTIYTSPNSDSSSNHNGGNIHFGPDGKLYVTIGDDANANTSQDLTSKNGKLHRLNPDGTAPSDNPNFGGQGALPTLYAIGLRNSFDFAFDPVVKGRIFASENGPGCDDEMNRIEAGGNYGWRAGYPCDDNDNPDPRVNTIPPLWFLSSGECCNAPTGITVYSGDQIPQWKNHLFMAVFSGGDLYHFTLNNDRTVAASTKIVRGVQANTDLETGPDGALYYIEGGGYGLGHLKRIVGTSQPAVTPTTPPVVGTPVPIPGNGSRRFPETGKTVTGIFLEYWDKNGGLPQQGFPISEVMAEISDLNGKTYTVQYFERAVFEYHPEIADPTYRVLLSQLGTFRYKQKYPQGAPNQHVSATNPIKFNETGKTMGGKFREYWEKNGGLPQQGFPISEEFMEVSDLNGKPYLVQYFERAVFEYHPENEGTPYEVLLSQLGTFRYKEKYGK